MAEQIRTAVVGVGYFGRFHAKHYASNPRAKLVAVIDTDEARARAVAEEFHVAHSCDYRSLFGSIDAVSVTVPTPLHFEIARDLLNAGIDVLIEKPIADSLSHAKSLTALADERRRVLQVGHIERFSAAYRALRKMIDRPLYIESYRISPWKVRGTEVDVVFDLMIHDIDIIMGLDPSPVIKVDAVGTPILSKSADLANARIVFESGCVATVTASRVSYKTERRMRVFQPGSYLNCDLATGQIFAYSLRGDPAIEGPAAIATQSFEVPKEDSLANEIADFLDCVASSRQPTVDGKAGCEALRVASLVNDSIQEHYEQARARFAG